MLRRTVGRVSRWRTQVRSSRSGVSVVRFTTMTLVFSHDFCKLQLYMLYISASSCLALYWSYSPPFLSSPSLFLSTFKLQFYLLLLSSTFFISVAVPLPLSFTAAGSAGAIYCFYFLQLVNYLSRKKTSGAQLIFLPQSRFCYLSMLAFLKSEVGSTITFSMKWIIIIQLE
jgi:hypothetical protein